MTTCRRSRKVPRVGRHWRAGFSGTLEVAKQFVNSLDRLVHSAIAICELESDDSTFGVNCFFVSVRQLSERAVEKLNLSLDNWSVVRFVDEESFVEEMSASEKSACPIAEVLKIRHFVSRAGRQAMSMVNTLQQRKRVKVSPLKREPDVGKEDVDPDSSIVVRTIDFQELIGMENDDDEFESFSRSQVSTNSFIEFSMKF